MATMQIRPDYTNSLAMRAGNQAARKLNQSASGLEGKAGKAAELQTKRQQLQNQMILLKAAGTDGAGAAAEMQKIVEAELEKATAELRRAKGSGAQAAGRAEEARLGAQAAAARRSVDVYEPEQANAASPGIYQVQKDGKGYKISFSPYREDETR